MNHSGDAVAIDQAPTSRILVHVSGYSRIQVKRLTNIWIKHGRLRPNVTSAGNGFTRKYTDADRRLLAELDELHNTLSGPATKKLCERAWQLFDLNDWPASRYRTSII